MNDSSLRAEAYWKVVNYSCCWHEKGISLESPPFVVNSLKKSSWCLQIYPKGTQESHDDGIGVLLRRLGSNAKKQKQSGAVTFEIAILVDDKLEASKSKKVKFEENSESGWKNFIKRSDLFVDGKSILPQDVLTIRCRIWRDKTKKQRVKKTTTNLRTVIKATGVSFPWSFDNFGGSVACFTKPVPIKIFPELLLNAKDSAIRMSYSTNANSEWFKISVCGQFLENWSWKCNIRFSNTSEPYLECSSIVASKDNSRVWMYRPMLTKKDILSNKERISNGILVLECDFLVVSHKLEQFVDDREPSNEGLSSACSSDSISLDEESVPLAALTSNSLSPILKNSSSTTNSLPPILKNSASTTNSLPPILKNSASTTDSKKDMSRDSPRTRGSLKQDSNEKSAKKDDKSTSAEQVLKNSKAKGGAVKSEYQTRRPISLQQDSNEKLTKKDDRNPSFEKVLKNSDGNEKPVKSKSKLEESKKLNEEVLNNAKSNTDSDLSEKFQKEALTVGKESKKRPLKPEDCNILDDSSSKRTHYDRTIKEKVARLSKIFDHNGDSNPVFESKKQKEKLCEQMMNNLKQSLSKRIEDDKITNVSPESNTVCPEGTLKDKKQALNKRLAEDKTENVSLEPNSEKMCRGKTLEDTNQSLIKNLGGNENIYQESESKRVCYENMLRDKKQTLNKILEVQVGPDVSMGSLSKKVCNKNVANVDESEVKDSITNLQQDIKQIYRNRYQADLVLKAESETFHVHKLILCARSAVFRKILEVKKEGYGFKLEMDAETASKMLEYIYTDDPGELNSKTAVKLSEAATKYRLFGLKKICSDYLLEHLDINNICEALKLVDTIGDEAVKSKVITFIHDHEKEVILSNAWQALMKENVELTSKTMFTLFELKFTKG